MNSNVRRVIRQTGIFSAAIAVVLSPIPLADEIVLLPVYGLMVSRIGRTHEVAQLEIPWRPIALTVLGGLAARAAINLTVSLIPGVSAVANAVSAAALTEILGRYVDAACLHPSATTVLTMRDIADQFRKRSAGAAAE